MTLRGLRLHAHERRTERGRLVVLIATGAYAAILSYFSLDRYHSFRANAYDLGIFDQAVWLLGHGLHPFVTVRGRNVFADHFQPGLELFAPLGALNLTPGGLLIVQSIALALPAPLLYAIARRRNASQLTATAISLLWLVSPLTHYANLADFHPETFVPALLLGGFLALESGRVVLFLVTAAIAVTLKEDVALLYAAWGVLLAFKGQRRLGIGLAAASVLWISLALTVGIPAFGGNSHYYTARFGGRFGSTAPQILRNMVEHPGWVFQTLVTRLNARMLGALVLSTAGLSLFAPAYLILALPALAYNLLSAYAPQHNLINQYHIVPAAVFALAAAAGAHTAETRLRRLSPRGIAAVCAVALIVFVALSPVLDAARGYYATRRVDDPALRKAKVDALRLIPPNAPVTASFDLTAHVANRREVYTAPDPFIRIPDEFGYWPHGFLRAARSRVRYVVLDGGESGPAGQSRINRLPPILLRLGFRVVYSRDGVRVYERGRPRSG